MTPETKAYIFKVSKRVVTLAVLWAAYQFWLLPTLTILSSHPHPILEALRQHVLLHLGGYLGSFGVLLIGVVSTRPKQLPKTGQDWYEWAGNAIESALPGRFRTSTPTQPVAPANQVK